MRLFIQPERTIWSMAIFIMSGLMFMVATDGDADGWDQNTRLTTSARCFHPSSAISAEVCLSSRPTTKSYLAARAMRAAEAIYSPCLHA